MVGLWVPVNERPMVNNKKTFSGGTEGNGEWVGMGKWGEEKREGLVATSFVNFYNLLLVEVT